ncbi:DMT family transporter [Aquibacillus sp. 3ASR75-11]|uniref:DMT family transporter n=1 Tax=Terrihalobacillus insolitus TaxID=2950438 RepID=A0A9X3WU12_9BACI|nr:DMT family transporter [Terrihalobacillus insolitus]MDC3413635.1 DMT family transporter [Terrihalobacillus insolitus]MDC3424608.1 DMT family transporter [Terrihalobacillus insolitus]
MNRVLYAALVVLTTALMGSSFAIGKIGLAYVSPLLLVAFRFTIAGVLMASIVWLLKREHPKTMRHWLQIGIIGLFQTSGVMGSIFVSLRTITAGESSILTFMNPLLVVIFGTVFLQLRYKIHQWAGVLLGFIGVFITFGAQINFKVGTILGFLSAVSWAIGTLLIKTWGQTFDTWVLTAYQMLFGGLILFGSSFLLEDPFFNVTLPSLSILMWLAIMASIVQFAGWFYLLQIGDPGKTSAFLFLAPFFGVLSGWIMLGESIQWYVMLGGVFIFSGIFLVNWTSKKMRARQRSEQQ